MLPGAIVRIDATVEIILKLQQIGRLQVRVHDLHIRLGYFLGLCMNSLPNRYRMMSCLSANHFNSLH